MPAPASGEQFRESAIQFYLVRQTGRAAGGIADGLIGPRVDNLHHLADDVPGCTELAIDTCRSELSEQIFIQVALGVTFCQRQFVDHTDRRDQQARLLDHKLGIFHVFGQRAAV